MRIEELISRDQFLEGDGRYLRGEVNDSLVVDTKRQLFFWNSRGIAGGPLDWLTKIKGMSKADAYKEVGHHTHISPLTYFSKKENFVVSPRLINSFFDYGKTHREYWVDRGYKHSTIDYFRLGYTGVWHTIPIFLDGEFRNFQCRMSEPKRMRPWYRGMGALPFNLDILKFSSDLCVISEGPVDAMMFYQNDLPAVSQTVGAAGWKVYRKYYGRFTDLDEIFICYDNDLAGDGGAIELAIMFGHQARIYNFWDFDKGFDASDYFNSGGTKEELMKLLNEKSKYWSQMEMQV